MKFHFDGSIADVRFWNYSRTESEIAADMAIEIDSSSSGLMAHFPLAEGSGTTTTDATGGAADGTIIGASWVGLSEFPITFSD